MKIMKHLLFLLALTLFFSQPSRSQDEHPLTMIEGQHVSLKLYDHAFAGSIRDFVVWGVMACKDAVAELGMRKHGQTIKTSFRFDEEKKLRGTVEHQDKAGATVKTRLALLAYNAADKTLTYEVNNDKYVVTVKPERIEDRHFVNPAFDILAPNGERIAFKITKGEACVGLSAKIAMLILAAYVHP